MQEKKEKKTTVEYSICLGQWQGAIVKRRPPIGSGLQSTAQ